MRIDHNISLCLGDDEICCSPNSRVKDPPPTRRPGPVRPTTTEPPTITITNTHTPKCGRHNSNGIGITIKNQKDGPRATQFAEWPHVCILYEVTYKGRDGEELKFLGGASLITPGIVITAAHKVQ